jgi:hypothetical protein
VASYTGFAWLNQATAAAAAAGGPPISYAAPTKLSTSAASTGTELDRTCSSHAADKQKNKNCVAAARLQKMKPLLNHFFF